MVVVGQLLGFRKKQDVVYEVVLYTCFDLKLVRMIAAFLITPPSHFPSYISTTANLVYHRLDNIIVRNRRETIKSLLFGVTEIKGSRDQGSCVSNYATKSLPILH